MTDITAITAITAIWTTNVGCPCPACRTARHEYHAAALDDAGEMTLTIDAATYDALSALATADDYRDGGYLAFTRPMQRPDVMTDLRGL